MVLPSMVHLTLQHGSPTPRDACNHNVWSEPSRATHLSLHFFPTDNYRSVDLNTLFWTFSPPAPHPSGLQLLKEWSRAAEFGKAELALKIGSLYTHKKKTKKKNHLTLTWVTLEIVVFFRFSITSTRSWLLVICPKWILKGERECNFQTSKWFCKSQLPSRIMRFPPFSLLPHYRNKKGAQSQQEHKLTGQSPK